MWHFCLFSLNNPSELTDITSYMEFFIIRKNETELIYQFIVYIHWSFRHKVNLKYMLKSLANHSLTMHLWHPQTEFVRGSPTSANHYWAQVCVVYKPLTLFLHKSLITCFVPFAFMIEALQNLLQSYNTHPVTLLPKNVQKCSVKPHNARNTCKFYI